MERVELLAPAKDLETVKLAIEAGADAVYLGGKQFSARFFATNLTEEDLKEAVIFAHQRGKKIYVTVNTIIYQSEWDALSSYLDYLLDIKVDAVIVQDLGVLYYLRTNYPTLTVHVSTQVNIYNQRGLDILAMLGVKRVVLARETSIDEIKNMNHSVIELETFVHGALCFCASGNCLMSYSIGNRSGNRGRCAQPCRKTYTLTENHKPLAREQALISMKDLCTIEELDKLIEAGITSFKIEGRMKSPQYVFTIVQAYRKAIDDYYTRKLIHITSDDLNKMKVVYNREFTKGFILNEKNALLTNVHHVNHQGIKIGNIIRWNPKSIEIQLFKSLAQHDAIRIENEDDIGFEIQKMFVNGKEKTLATAGEIVKIPITINRCLGKDVLKTKSAEITTEIKNFMLKEHVKIPLKGAFYLKWGDLAKLEITDGKHTVCVFTTEKLTNLANNPQTDEFYFNVFNKLGNTPFYFTDIKFVNDYKTFISIKDLNQLRRDAVMQLLEKRSKISLNHDAPLLIKEITYSKLPTTFEAIVHTKEQYEICKKYGIETIYTDYPSPLMVASRLSKKSIPNAMIHNLGQFTKNNVVSPYFNVVNQKAIQFLKNMGAKKIYLSYEVELSMLKDLNLAKFATNIGIPIYGKMDVMTFKHCIIAKAKGYENKNCHTCINNHYELEDAYNNKFAIFTNPMEGCTSRLIDSKIRNLTSHIDDLEKRGIHLFLFTFTTETVEEIEAILNQNIKIK